MFMYRREAPFRISSYLLAYNFVTYLIDIHRAQYLQYQMCKKEIVVRTQKMYMKIKHKVIVLISVYPKEESTFVK